MGEMNVIGTHEVRGLDELNELAQALARQLVPGDVVLLGGNLGAGKTTFTQFLGKALGVQEHITSPTYTLIGEYPVVGHSKIQALIHMDLYRVGEGGKKISLNDEYVQEILKSALDDNAIVVIEWAEKMAILEGAYCWNIGIATGQSSERRIVTISRK